MSAMRLQSEGARRAGAAASSSRRARPSRRWLLGALLALAVAVTFAATRGEGAAQSARFHGSGAITTASTATFQRAMVARLATQHAHFHWVACVRSGRRYGGVAIVRCNVNFGDPHIQAYCSVFRAGRLLTSADDPRIPCGHDDAGFSATIVTYR